MEINREWFEQALCAGMDVEKFFDRYEEDYNVANMVDSTCLACPVMRECFFTGCNTESWGVWGGIYLIDGKIDKNKNAHKNKETWRKIYSVIKDDN